MTVVANWIPFEDPAGGPNFYRFDDRAHYYLNVDNTGDGELRRPVPVPVQDEDANPNSFLYAAPTVDSIRSKNLNVQQSYTITRELYSKGKKTSAKVVARNVPVAPNNVGPKTIPDYDERRQPGDPPGCRAAARCSPASATIRSSSTSAARSTRSTSATAPATPVAARTTWPATACTRSSCRSRRAR